MFFNTGAPDFKRLSIFIPDTYQDIYPEECRIELGLQVSDDTKTLEKPIICHKEMNVAGGYHRIILHSFRSSFSSDHMMYSDVHTPDTFNVSRMVGGHHLVIAEVKLKNP